jgi:hypothetical protein
MKVFRTQITQIIISEVHKKVEAAVKNYFVEATSSKRKFLVLRVYWVCQKGRTGVSVA